MKQSCDTYFYEIARKLGVDRLSVTAKKFGLGKEEVKSFKISFTIYLIICIFSYLYFILNNKNEK